MSEGPRPTPERPLMACGHVANGTREGKPVCVICVGIHKGAEEVAPERPSLEGRRAKCACGKGTESDYNLPFFEHRPLWETDAYYCGCDGWD